MGCFCDLSLCTNEAQKSEMWRRIWLPFFTYLIIYAFVYLFFANISSFWNHISALGTCTHTLYLKKMLKKKLLQTWQQFENFSLQMKSQPVSTLSLVLHFSCFMHFNFFYVCYKVLQIYLKTREINALK